MTWTSDNPTEDGYYWYKDQAGHTASVQKISGGYHVQRYGYSEPPPGLWYGPLTPPPDRTDDAKEATEQNDNTLLSPLDLINDVACVLADEDDAASKATKCIVLLIWEPYSTATFRCNLSDSEAVALLTAKAAQYSRNLIPDDDSEEGEEWKQ